MSRGTGFWWRWLAATAVLFGAVWAVLVVLDTGPRPGRLLLLVTLVTAVLALVNVALMSNGPDWSVDSAAPAAPAGQDTRLGMYTLVLAGHLDARLPDARLRDRLAALADRRLRQRHGLNLHDPRSVPLLGREVADILTGPARRLSRSEIETCVVRIEEL